VEKFAHSIFGLRFFANRIGIGFDSMVNLNSIVARETMPRLSAR
jgi:hypothetical protein